MRHGSARTGAGPMRSESDIRHGSGCYKRRGGSIAPFRWVGAVALLLLAGCGDGRTPLVLYSPHGRDLLKLLETRYEEIHPEIDVRWLDMGSQEIYDRVRSEAANPQCDVWFGGPDTIFARGAADDLFEPFRPSWAGELPPESRHPEDLYFGIYLAVPILFSTPTRSLPRRLRPTGRICWTSAGRARS